MTAFCYSDLYSLWEKRGDINGFNINISTINDFVQSQGKTILQKPCYHDDLDVNPVNMSSLHFFVWSISEILFSFHSLAKCSFTSFALL